MSSNHLETSHYCECHEGYIDGSYDLGKRIDPATGLPKQGTGKGPKVKMFVTHW